MKQVYTCKIYFRDSGRAQILCSELINLLFSLDIGAIINIKESEAELSFEHKSNIKYGIESLMAFINGYFFYGTPEVTFKWE